MKNKLLHHPDVTHESLYPKIEASDLARTHEPAYLEIVAPAFVIALVKNSIVQLPAHQ